MAVFTQTQSGSVIDGGTYGNTSPGVSGTDFPGTGDDCVTGNTFELRLPATHTMGSLDIVSGSSLALLSSTSTITLDGENGSGFALTNAGGVPNNVDIIITTAATTACDFTGSSGNFRNFTLNSGNICYFTNTPSTLEGNVTVISGTFRGDTNTRSLSMSGELVVLGGTLGHTGWTGALTVSGSIYNAGTWVTDTSIATVSGSIYGPGTFPSYIENVNNIYNLKNILFEWGIWDSPNVMQMYGHDNPDRFLHQPRKGDW